VRCERGFIIIIIIIIINGIYIAQVRKGHKCAMSAEMAVWQLRNCLFVSLVDVTFTALCPVHTAVADAAILSGFVASVM